MNSGTGTSHTSKRLRRKSFDVDTQNSAGSLSEKRKRRCGRVQDERHESLQETACTHAATSGIDTVTLAEPRQHGNSYGSTHISGNARVQMGDVYHSHADGDNHPGSTTIMGNMFVNHNYHEQREKTSGPSSQNQHTDEATLNLKRALYYQSMETRKAQLDQVEPASFEWVWTETTFASWLQSGRGLYWICGKPASGKSTLINYLLRDGSEKVKSHLPSGSESTLLLHFFFDFRAGTSIANTPLGMLRSLLLQLINASDAVKDHVLITCGYKLSGFWPELETELLDLICESVRCERRTICGFIDGLDEYEGSLSDLVDTIVSLQRRTSMKLCLSSRPLSELSYKLGKESILMQDHNRSTIRSYVTMALFNIDFITQEEMDEVNSRIEQNANGVILWARFAVDEVIRELLKGERLESASQRLQDFPTDLKSVYERILGKLSRAEKFQATVIFFVVESWQESRTHYEPLVLESLMLTYSSILHDLGDRESAKFSTQEDVTRFSLKIKSMLPNLIEFESPNQNCSGWRPVLVHKSLKSFLLVDQGFISSRSRIRQVRTSEILAPLFMCQNMILAADVLDPTTLPETSLRPKWNMRPKEQLKDAKHTLIVQDCLWALWRCSSGLFWQDAGLLPCFVKATQTWTYRCIVRYYYRAVNAPLLHGLSALRQVDCFQFLHDNYAEVLEYVRAGQHLALENALMALNNLSAGEKEKLRKLCKRQRVGWKRSTYKDSASEDTDSENDNL